MSAECGFRERVLVELPDAVWCEKNPRDPSTTRPSVNQANRIVAALRSGRQRLGVLERAGIPSREMRFPDSLSRGLPDTAWRDKNPRDPSTTRPSVNRAIASSWRFAQDDSGRGRLQKQVQKQAEGRRFFCCGEEKWW
jgi:hypothetical protein